MAAKKDLNLEGRLVLHSWANDLFGYGSAREMLGDLERADEGFDGEGRSGVFYRLRSRSDRLRVPLDDLERYDDNIRQRLEAINRHRPEPVTLRYFQYVAALYAEVFLDRWSGDRDALAAELNAFAGSMEEPVTFAADELNKLAFWMATGGGKTLLMHLNYRQFLFYAKQPPDNVLLITPNAGLTEQHLDEMRKSGIPCERFSAGESGLGLVENVVRVIEITKLTRNKKGGGESVDVESFEGRSLIFVDEGHKGAGGGKDSNLEKAWRPLRQQLAEKGFTFEYSATFGQAVQASKSEALAEEYGKSILFDYSYRHFYEDGYGKDFRILNLKNQTGEYTDLLLLGNLLSFHEQRRYHAEHRDELKPYRLLPPLWVFVGSSVNKEGGDVLTVARFLQRFLKNEGGWSVDTIEKLLEGDTRLQDGDGRDAFAGRFGYLKGKGETAREVFKGVLREAFHAGAGGTLRVADIKGSEGELGLKVAGAERYFGLIYIGDTSAFKKLLEAGAPEVVVEDDAISGSLFRDVDGADSQVNVLIGAKKFIEGWSSWRVSNMGLLNIGKSEGSQIIQLFGRGVRLKGLDFSLKRSSFVGGPEDHPERIDLLETLNIFAVEANYMVEFRKYLEREGVDPGGYEEIPFPIHREDALIGEGLYVPAVPDGSEFFENSRVVLDEHEDIRVNLDLSIKAESMRMGEGGVSTVAAKAGQGRLIGEPYLSMLDWTRVYLDLLDYKNSRKLHNLIIPPDAPRRIMEKRDPAAYNLIADDSVFEPESFAGFAVLQETVQSILRKYVDRFYGVRQQRWDSENMVLRELTGDHPNFADYAVKIKVSEEALIEEVRALANRANSSHDGDAGSLPNIYFDRHLYQPLLKDRGDEVKVSPPGLEESEEKFIAALRACCRRENGGPDGKKLFLLRNLTRSKGVGFFNTAGFYPDFILWVKDADGSQKVVFVEPHGMRNDDPPPYNEKVDLHLALRDLSDRIARRDGQEVFLDSYVVSATPFHELSSKWGEGWTRERFARRHVLFEDDLDAGIPALVSPRDDLERRISTSYPLPLALGFRPLASIVDPRDLYREQLRIAENVLAFLASISLALLREEDRERAGLDLKKYWSGGISPGDWKEIVGRCSKVFAGYRDVPLAVAIQKLKILSENKGFGRDIYELIKAKNDYKHDRGPSGLEEITSASDEAQERLRRCMEALAFFTDYPLRRVEECNVDRSGDGFLLKCSRYTGDHPDLPWEEVVLHEGLREDELFLELGGGDWLPLYPFIVPMTCPRCKVAETYFIDAWDRKKNTARMKSFERGHTMSNPEVSDSLSGWTTSA
ncbi:MAG: FIG00641605: hypothetical protein [uncultured Rubrobacteraceae bacterium]|uniref:Helicase ATP-binding domain-containing protein n=1 Tax=uncultured Rubrobacteraceae bacterium TaxID=349277 RepID=A0A6J4R5E2_9ACTN|nr:MAG: FIG00641605: hypothetical protein [uncultured Rubrobacteraceae bacterium]